MIIELPSGSQDPRAVSLEVCPTCNHANALDSRAPKCWHFCLTCSSVHKRLVSCKSHPSRKEGGERIAPSVLCEVIK